MELYQMNDLVKKYGAADYLRSLRRRLSAGECTRQEFCYNAARAYIAGEKPLRALSLATLVDPDYAPDADQIPMRNIASLATKLAAGMEHRTCSLNMIARDEGLSIGAALDSVDDIVDEIVIGDTGSVDNTCDIALTYGVTLRRIPWTHDFSAARNYLIEHSQCDWIFWIDADDRLDPAAREALPALWRTSPNQAMAFCIVNEQKNNFGPEFLQFRLFPRQSTIRFERRVHEQIVFSAVRAGVPTQAHQEVRIMHTGYIDADTQKRKAARNKPLIIESVRERPDDLVLRLSLGECHALLGEVEQAIAVFRFIADAEENLAKDRDTHVRAHYLAGWLYQGAGDAANAKRYLYRCLYLDPTVIEAHYVLGRVWLAEKNLQNALHFFVKAAQIQPRLQLLTAADFCGIRAKALYYTAEILLTWKKTTEVTELLQRALLAFPQVVDFYSQMGRALLAQARFEDAARFFRRRWTSLPSTTRRPTSGLQRYTGCWGTRRVALSS